MKALTCRLEKLLHRKDENEGLSEISIPSDCQMKMKLHSFEDLIQLLQSETENIQMPDDLQGGILIDRTYEVSPKHLNAAMFAPNSEFKSSLADFQGMADVKEGHWKWESGGLRRSVTYIKAATKLVKAVRATEEQAYVKAGNNCEFAVLVNVSTPDVPYGNTFRVELLYKIMPGVVLSAGGQSARLVVSFVVNFSQSTMMKGMIESGAKHGLQESFDQFSCLLSQTFKVVDILEKDNVVATMEMEHKSGSELSLQYFWNFTVVSTLFLLLYVIIHIFLCKLNTLRGLEFEGVDLPDSFGEIITSGILILQLERVYLMISHFVEARLRRGSDHGIKAQGDGWVLTVALIEGTNLASQNSTELCDPYVVFTCNGKTRTSSVKLQLIDPQWNEILEFDAVEEPPSVLDVEVFNFDGPFDQASSLGHAEINFLKHTASELADLWVPLDGKLAQSSQSKLHLRIFLDNNNGVETIRDYLANLEVEVGKKGRLFLSARIVGFYVNLFGHKTRFYFLWEDIEDIKVNSPSLSTVGSPSLVLILIKGRGLDARHGAKVLDDHGRLCFYFHSFVSFNDASRTIMALWRSRTLEPDEKAEIRDKQVEDDEKPFLIEDARAYLVVEDANMIKVFTMELPLNLESLMKMFDGGELEHKVMSKSGCLNYVTTTWEHVTSDVQERCVSYKFNRRISIFGGEVMCRQQKSPLPNNGGWVVNEIMSLHNAPFSDHFQVQLRYQIEKSSFAQSWCKCDIYIGVVWHRSTKFESRITRNIIGKFTNRLEEILQMVESEILLTRQ